MMALDGYRTVQLCTKLGSQIVTRKLCDSQVVSQKLRYIVRNRLPLLIPERIAVKKTKKSLPKQARFSSDCPPFIYVNQTVRPAN